MMTHTIYFDRLFFVGYMRVTKLPTLTFFKQGFSYDNSYSLFEIHQTAAGAGAGGAAGAGAGAGAASGAGAAGAASGAVSPSAVAAFGV